MPTAYVYLELDGRDPEDYAGEATRTLAQKVSLPAGYTLAWSGEYEALGRVRARLKTIVPLTLVLVAVLLYGSTRSAVKTGIVLLAVPFSAIGAVWGLWLLGYAMSPAVWVGLIALLGVDAETGAFMLLYLDLAWQKGAAEGRMRTAAELREAVLSGAARRIRPKFMTVATMFLGLVPILWSTGAGSEVMKRIAAPMAGGLATSFLMELLVYPLVYEFWRGRAGVPLVPACTERDAPAAV
jgi:Cu(I)/Ag(I) efflux system membrane protein CusA/SilA